MMYSIPFVRGLPPALLAVAAVGCGTFTGPKETRQQSSVVEFLYPKERDLKIQPSIPRLDVPLDVGIAFVPADEPRGRRRGQIEEVQKRELLETVAGQFHDLPFVRRIEIIPTAYLSPGGGFRNLDQIAAMHGVEVMALVSFDQVQHTDESRLSIAYWTLVGAYIFAGERNDTSTMLDTAVYHVASRKLLFRAPGTSRVKGRSAPVNLTRELREDSAEGLADANEDMIANLTTELDRFKKEIKAKPTEYVVTQKAGYKGTGVSAHGPGAVIALSLLGFTRWRRKRKN